MLDFLHWYFPWSRVDLILKIELAVWFGAVVAAFLIPIWALVLKKTWLPMSHLPPPTDENKAPESDAH